MARKHATVQSQVDKQAGIFFCVEAGPYRQAVDRPRPADEYQLVGLAAPQQLVVDIIEGLRAVKDVDRPVYRGFGEGEAVRLDKADHARQVLGFGLADSFETVAAEAEDRVAEVDGRRIVQALNGASHLLADSQQVVALPGNGSFAPLDERIYALGIETEHVVGRHFGVDQDIGILQIAQVCIAAGQVDGLGGDIEQVVQLLITIGWGGDIHADHDVDPHDAGQVGGKIIAHASIDQHHAVDFDRGENPGDGHGRAQGGVQVAAHPDFLFGRDHFGGDADKRPGQVEKVGFALVADGERTEKTAYVLAIDDA